MNKKPNVLVDGLVFENNYQLGIWRIFSEIMSRRPLKGNVTLMLREKAVQPLPAGVKIVRSYRREIPNNAIISRLRRKLANLRSPLRRLGLNVFHSTYFTLSPVPGAAVVVSVFDMIAERMFAITPWSDWQEHFAIKRQAILSADLCIAISESTAEDLARFYPEVKGRVRVVPLGADHLGMGTQPAQNAPSNERYVLFVGSRNGYKNFGAMLDAVRSRSWPADLELRIVGPPLNEGEHLLIKTLVNGRQVRHLGRLSDGELREQYASAQCFAFPSLLEGFGLPLLEAQNYGCPVIASDIPVFREVARDAALYFDPRLGEQLAAAVLEAGQSEVRNRLVNAGYENVRRYSWDRAAEQTMEVYSEAVFLANKRGFQS